MGRRAKTLTKQKRIASGGLCTACGSPIIPTKNKRYGNTHLCKDCNGETKVDFMPTPEYIAAEMAAIKAEGGGQSSCHDEEITKSTVRVYQNPMHGRMRAGNRVY